MQLIYCKVELSLEQYEITDTILYVPVVTLKTEDNVKLPELLSNGFERPIY